VAIVKHSSLEFLNRPDAARDKPSEVEPRRSDRAEAIGNIAACLAHDLNNLLSVVLSCTALALEQLKAKDDVRTDIQEAHDAARHAAALTRRLLAVGRAKSPVRVQSDVNESLSSTEKLLQRILGSDIRLTVVANAESCVPLESIELHQILFNLTANARDAMPSGGQLTIEASDVTVDPDDAEARTRPGKWVRLSVADNGCGMDAQTRARIFEPFFTTKAPDRGTGLGLTTVSAIVARCGGHLTIESEVDRGTQFDIYFPADDVPATSSCTLPRTAAEGVDGVADTETRTRRSA
jgi:signal transduction histidine kinase